MSGRVRIEKQEVRRHSVTLDIESALTTDELKDRIKLILVDKEYSDYRFIVRGVK